MFSTKYNYGPRLATPLSGSVSVKIRMSATITFYRLLTPRTLKLHSPTFTLTLGSACLCLHARPYAGVRMGEVVRVAIVPPIFIHDLMHRFAVTFARWCAQRTGRAQSHYWPVSGQDLKADYFACLPSRLTPAVGWG